MLRRHFAGLALATIAVPAFAQGDKVTRLVIGFPAGQATDVIARLLADGLKGELGETVIVDNKPGQGDRKSTRLNSSHSQQSRMPSSA